MSQKKKTIICVVSVLAVIFVAAVLCRSKYPDAESIFGMRKRRRMVI